MVDCCGTCRWWEELSYAILHVDHYGECRVPMPMCALPLWAHHRGKIHRDRRDCPCHEPYKESV